MTNFINEEETEQVLEKTTLEDPLHTDHLDDIENDYVLKIAKENRDRFFLPDNELPRTDKVMYRMLKTIDELTRGRQYKFPHALKDEINKQVEELLNAGIIKPSHSQYNTRLYR